MYTIPFLWEKSENIPETILFIYTQVQTLVKIIAIIIQNVYVHFCLSFLNVPSYYAMYKNERVTPVASITNETTDRQDKYLVSLISTLVASHFKSGYRTIITVYKSVSENVKSLLNVLLITY